MKSLLMLLPLFILSCEDETQTTNNNCIMIISDSLPFQFWQAGKSFNSNQICGVNPQCYCAPWLCDKEIRLQVKDVIEGQTLNLLIMDEQENVLKTLEFDETEVTVQVPISPALQFSNTDFPSDLTGWNNFGGNDRTTSAAKDFVFSTGEARAFSFSASKTKYFATQRPTNPSAGWPVGNYVVSIQGRNDGGSAITPSVYTMPDGNSQTIIASTLSSTIPNDGNTHVVTLTFTLSSNAPYLAFAFDGTVATTLSFNIEEIELTTAPTTEGEYEETIYDLAFTPSELTPELCNKRVFFKIVGDEDERLTDCINIQSTNQNCLTEVIYSNSKDFDNIKYQTTPAPVFRIIVEAQFWKEDNPQEQEDSVLSNGVIVTRRSEIQEKTLFETGYLPNYLHKKLQKIFMHNYVVIEDVTGDEIQWKKRDAYETENLNRYPLKRAQVWLTKYNSVEKNTI